MKKLSLWIMSLLAAGSTMVANAQTKPVETLTVDAVQAANLDSYYQTSGKWEFAMANGENVVATLAVTTSGYNHIAGQYDLAGSDSEINVHGTETVTAGSLTVEYVSEGTDFAVYHFVGTMETASTIYNLDVTIEVLAYDYLYYLYYEMGVFSYQQILIVLDDAPEDGEHATHEVTLTSGYLLDYVNMMGAIQVRAENEEGLLAQIILDADEMKDNTTYPMSTTYAIYCYLGDMNTQVYLAYFKSGSATVKCTAEGRASVDATLVAKGGDVWHIVVTDCEAEGLMPEGGQDSLSAQEMLRTLAQKRMLNGKLTIERNGVLWGADGITVKN